MGLRSALTTNLPLKLTSLLLAVMLWIVVAGEEPGTKAVPVDVVVRAPAGRTIVSAIPPVTAIVAGPRRELFQLTHAEVLLAPTGEVEAAERTLRFRLAPDDLILPHDANLRVQAIHPAEIVVDLDTLRVADAGDAP